MGSDCSCSSVKTETLNQIRAEVEPNDIKQPTPPVEQQTRIKIPRSRANTVKVTQPANTEHMTRTRKHTEREIVEIKKRVKIVVEQNLDLKDNVVFDSQRNYEIYKLHYLKVEEMMKKHFVFSQLSTQEMQYIMRKMKFCIAQKDSYIFKQGDRSFSYYIILEGSCQVEVNGKKKSTLKAGDAFGDIGIVYNTPRSASILATTECLLAELDRDNFCKVISELNFLLQAENRKALEKLQFYSMLNDPQKNALAANCLTETYNTGTVIFHKGDAANAFYVVLEGIVTILQKKIDLKVGQNLGSNVFHQQNAFRSCSLVAKTKCKLLSITKNIVQQVLGGSIANIVNRQLVEKIIQQSNIYDLVRTGDWNQIINNMTITKFQKKDLVLVKGTTYESYDILIPLGAELKNSNISKSYMANTVILQRNLQSGENYQIDEDFYAESSGYLVVLKCPSTKNEQGLLVASWQGQAGELDINDFYVMRKLKSGNYGRIYACCKKNSEKKYAIKAVCKKKADGERVVSEINKQHEVLSYLPKHLFIAQYFSIVNDDEMIAQVFGLIEGSNLFQFLNSTASIPNSQIRFYVKQIVLMLEHLHRYKVVFRDLRPQNILLGADGYLTLVNFKNAKKLTIQNRYKTSTVIGTPHYMAPEITTGKGYSFSSDWWPLGIIIFQLWTGKVPFGEHLDDPFSIYEQIQKKHVFYPLNMDSASRELTERLLKKNPHERWGEGYNQLKKLTYFSRTFWDKLLKKIQKPNFIPIKRKIADEEVERSLKKKNNRLKEVFINSKLGDIKKIDGCLKASAFKKA